MAPGQGNIISPELENSNKLHQTTAKKTTFISKVVEKDKDLYKEKAASYFDFWETKDSGKNDSEDGNNNIESRLSKYTQLTNAYYDLATDFYEYGWGRSFHFSRFYKGENFAQSIARHEHYLALKLSLKEGMKVLDVGCGVGGPAREIARFSGCHVTGFNNNDYQLERCAHYATAAGLESQWAGHKGNFMEMDIADNVFDAVYAIEATVHAPELAGVYGEIYRVLKPGASFACYEWCTTSLYNENDPEQARTIREIEEGNGIPKLRSTEFAVNALRSVGFQVDETCDFAENEEIPWYRPLEGGLFGAFQLSRIGRMTTDVMCRLMEKVGVAPTGTTKVSQLLSLAGDSLLEGGRQKIFTPMFFFKVTKPLNA